MSAPRLNDNIAKIAVYQPGRPIEDVARQFNLVPSEVVKLASNENPLGPSPKAAAAAREAAAACHWYPDGGAIKLKAALAAQLGVSPAHLMIGNGSNEIIELIGHGYLAPGRGLVVSEYAFSIYALVAQMFGAPLTTVRDKSYGHDLTAMGKAVNPSTSVLAIVNPNNPTGTRAANEEVLDAVMSAPEHVLVVVDEAYFEFMRNPPDLLALIRAGRGNLVLLRTFSKIFGLAGLRIGYAIAHPDLIRDLEKTRQPFNVNSIALEAAHAALGDREHLAKSAENNRRGQAYFAEELRSIDVPFIPSECNFLMAEVGNGGSVFEAMQRRGVIVRPLAPYKLPAWIRISVGTDAQNRRCVEELRRALKR